MSRVTTPAVIGAVLVLFRRALTKHGVAPDDLSERSAYVQLLDKVADSTDEEPDTSFADEEVLVRVDELCLRFCERVRGASGRP
jgi:hypothetical protein